MAQISAPFHLPVRSYVCRKIAMGNGFNGERGICEGVRLTWYVDPQQVAQQPLLPGL